MSTSQSARSELSAAYEAPKASLLAPEPEPLPRLVVWSLGRGWLGFLVFLLVALGAACVYVVQSGLSTQASDFREATRLALGIPHRDVMRAGFWCLATLWTAFVTARRAGRHGVRLALLQGGLFSLVVGSLLVGLPLFSMGRAAPIDVTTVALLLPCALLGGWISRRTSLENPRQGVRTSA